MCCDEPKIATYMQSFIAFLKNNLINSQKEEKIGLTEEKRTMRNGLLTIGNHYLNLILMSIVLL